MKGRPPKNPKTRRRQPSKTATAKVESSLAAGAAKERARRVPKLPAYESVMGVGVQLAVGRMLVELAERVTRVTAAAAEIARAAEDGETLDERARGIAEGLVEDWAKEIGKVVEGGRPDWHVETKRWWRDIWRSPMAAEWLSADQHALNRLAVLVEEFWRGPTQQLLAEIRLQEQRFGLTWADRHRLQFKPESKAAPARRGSTQPAAAVAATEETPDPRHMLRVVATTKKGAS